MSDTELKPVEQAVLVDILVHRDDKASNIANRTGYHRNSVSSRLTEMVESGYVQNKGGGVYRLTDTGRNTALGLVRGGYLPYTD